MERNIKIAPTVKGCFSCPFFDKCPQDCRGFIVTGEETFCPKKDNPTSARLYMNARELSNLTTITSN